MGVITVSMTTKTPQDTTCTDKSSEMTVQCFWSRYLQFPDVHFSISDAGGRRDSLKPL